MYIPSLQNCRH